MYELALIFGLILIVELIWFNTIRQRYLKIKKIVNKIKIKIKKKKRKKSFITNKKNSAGFLRPTDSIPNYDNNTKFFVRYSLPYHLTHADHLSSSDLA